GSDRDQQRSLPVPLMEIQQGTVVEGPDPVSVFGVLAEGVDADALYRVRDVPGWAVDEEIAGRGAGLDQDVVPEVEQQGCPGVLPPPRAGAAAALFDQLPRRHAKLRQTAAVEPFALGPAPVAEARIVLPRASVKHPQMEVVEVRVLEVAPGIV